jgi:hypothetical protein
MIIQTIRFSTALSLDEVLSVAKERAPQFQALAGLVQKYYVKTEPPGQIAGIYLWDSMDSLEAYRGSALAKSIPKAYQVQGTPVIDTYEVLFPLRD